LEWTEYLRAQCATPFDADLREMRVRRARGEYKEVLELLDHIGEGGVDDDGNHYTREHFAWPRVEALSQLGRPREAVEVYLGVLPPAQAAALRPEMEAAAAAWTGVVEKRKNVA
jgi:hypothetical protein